MCGRLSRQSKKNSRDDKWTKSIAAGNKSFVERVKFLIRALAKGRKDIGVGESLQLREPAVTYGAHFGLEKCDIDPNLLLGCYSRLISKLS